MKNHIKLSLCSFSRMIRVTIFDERFFRSPLDFFTYFLIIRFKIPILCHKYEIRMMASNHHFYLEKSKFIFTLKFLYCRKKIYKDLFELILKSELFFENIWRCKFQLSYTFLISILIFTFLARYMCSIEFSLSRVFLCLL